MPTRLMHCPHKYRCVTVLLIHSDFARESAPAYGEGMGNKGDWFKVHRALLRVEVWRFRHLHFLPMGFGFRNWGLKSRVFGL